MSELGAVANVSDDDEAGPQAIVPGNVQASPGVVDGGWNTLYKSVPAEAVPTIDL